MRNRYIIPVAFFLFFIWSIISTGFNVKELINGIPSLINFINCMVPPAWEVFIPLVQPAIETIQMAFLGTVFAVILSIPVALLAANNITPSKPVKVLASGFIAFTRTVPDIVFALIFISAVGLVGAGGIGFELIMTMRLFRYHEMFTILIIIFIIVVLCEWASNSIRTHIIGEEVLK